jgi:hypothetical protein
MNTISETIPAVFSPETAFSISLHAMNEKPEQESEGVVSLRFRNTHSLRAAFPNLPSTTETIHPPNKDFKHTT